MAGIGQFLDGLASLAWPALLFFLAWRFAKPIHSVIESARGRKFTIKVGKNELTMEEITNQQRRQMADLQEKVAAIAPLQETSASSEPTELASSPYEPTVTEAFSILWVDDYPTNNSWFIR